MKLIHLSSFLVLMLLIPVIGILPVMAEKEFTGIREGGAPTAHDENITLLSENETHINQSFEEESLPEDASSPIGKTPGSLLIFAEENSTGSPDAIRETSIPDDASPDDQISNNSTSVSEKYESLGDIIRAKDWKALGEYNCKVKTENPEKFDDSIPTLSDLQSKWNDRFTSPIPIVYAPCCG